MKMSESEQSQDKVVLEQTLLRVEETFVYKIPPLATSGGHHADDWDLGNPLATCSLHVKRVDSTLCIQLLKDQPKPNAPPGATEKHLFAQCIVSLNLSSNLEPTLKMHYYVEPVTDSSRYFVIRISDAKSGREAHIGMGFRERNDALNFKMSLQDYENAMRKEAISLNNISKEGDSFQSAEQASESETSDDIGLSKLTLKEGEKIHINIKGIEGKRRQRKSVGEVNPGGKSMLLKKPPPPASALGAAVESPEGFQRERHESISNADPAAKIEEDNDDDWGDFEGVTNN
jgi:hypothetical protein